MTFMRVRWYAGGTFRAVCRGGKSSGEAGGQLHRRRAAASRQHSWGGGAGVQGAHLLQDGIQLRDLRIDGRCLRIFLLQGSYSRLRCLVATAHPQERPHPKRSFLWRNGRCT